MPRPCQRILSYMTLAIACASALNPSVFLTHEEYATLTQEAGSVTCDWSKLENGVYCNGSETYTTTLVDQLLSEHAYDLLTSSRIKSDLKSRILDGEKHVPADVDLGHKNEGQALNRLHVVKQAFWGAQFAATLEQHKHASMRPGIPAFSALAMDTPTDLICLELSLIQRIVNVVLPIRTHAMLRLQLRHSRDFLESHFGAIFALSQPETVMMLSNKSHFHTWMIEHDLGKFMPTAYQTPNEVQYPCLVKATNLGLGEGVYIVSNRSELDAAIQAEGVGSYIMSEAILGSIKHCIFFVAHQGRSVAYLSHITKHEGDLFIDGSKLRVPSQLVYTPDMIALSPAYSILKKIVRLTKFTGFGCIEFKLIPAARSEGQISDYLSNLAPVSNTTDAIFTDMALLLDDIVESDYAAIPKFFEVNSRLCQSLHNTWVPAFYEMMKLFVRAVVEEEG